MFYILKFNIDCLYNEYIDNESYNNDIFNNKSKNLKRNKDENKQDFHPIDEIIENTNINLIDNIKNYCEYIFL